jgi:hypothetical protein
MASGSGSLIATKAKGVRYTASLISLLTYSSQDLNYVTQADFEFLGSSE